MRKLARKYSKKKIKKVYLFYPSAEELSLLGLDLILKIIWQKIKNQIFAEESQIKLDYNLKSFMLYLWCRSTSDSLVSSASFLRPSFESKSILCDVCGQV